MLKEPFKLFYLKGLMLKDLFIQLMLKESFSLFYLEGLILKDHSVDVRGIF